MQFLIPFSIITSPIQKTYYYYDDDDDDYYYYYRDRYRYYYRVIDDKNRKCFRYFSMTFYIQFLGFLNFIHF